MGTGGAKKTSGRALHKTYDFDPKLYRSAVFSKKNKRGILGFFKESAPAYHIPFMVEDLCKTPTLKIHFARNSKPARFSDIQDLSPLPRVDIQRELIWCTSVFIEFADEISEFSQLRMAFERCVISSKFEEAVTFVDKIVEKFGYSYWALNAKLNCYSMTDDGDERTRLMNDILDYSGGFSQLIAFYIQKRTDPKYSSEEYRGEVRSIIETPGISDHFREYLAYLLSPTDLGSDFDPVTILSYDEPATIVDRYMSYLDSLERACELGVFDEAPLVASSVGPLSEYIGDERLLAIAPIVVENAILPEARADVLEAINNYTSGRYEDALRGFSRILEADPCAWTLWEPAAKSLARCNFPYENTPLPSLVIDMAATYLKGAGSDEAVARLERFVLSDAVRPAAVAITAFLARETWQCSGGSVTRKDARVAMSGRTWTPWSINALQKHCFLKPVTWCDESSVGFRIAQLATGQASSDDLSGLFMPESRKAMYSAYAKIASGNFEGAVEDLHVAHLDDFAPARYEAAKNLVSCLTELKKYREAASLIAATFVDNPKTARLFDLANFLSCVESDGLPSAYSEIGLSIVYEMYSQNISGDRDPFKSDAAEEFVTLRGVKLPSEIEINNNLSTRKMYLHFLHKVCTPRVLGSFLGIRLSSQVDLERIAICQRLTELDSVNSRIYAAEIRDITRNIVVRQRLKDIAQSKIYVDTGNIKRRSYTNLKEQFVRYQALISTTDPNDVGIRVIQSVNQASGQRDLSVSLSDIPQNASEIVFEQLANELFGLLVTNREHGLETYLSTRIRHGTLSGYLRSPLEVANLVTRKSEDEVTYTKDTFWREELDISISNGDGISDIICRFSSRIDRTIERLVKDWIQIKGTEHEEGLFDFSEFRSNVFEMRKSVRLDADFDNFLDTVIDAFWKCTEQSLSIVRHKIDHDFRSEINSAFDELHSEIGNQGSSGDLTALLSAIAAARTGTQNAIETVMGWFRVTTRIEHPDYSFDIAVEVAAKSVESCFRNRPMILDQSIQIDRDLSGATLSSVVDLLFILFENAVTKSNLDNGPRVWIRALGSDETILLEVENEVQKVANASAATEELERRVAFSETAEAQRRMTLEGGSGFPKVIRIAAHDLRVKYQLSAQFCNVDRFRVNLDLSGRRLFA